MTDPFISNTRQGLQRYVDGNCPRQGSSRNSIRIAALAVIYWRVVWDGFRNWLRSHVSLNHAPSRQERLGRGTPRVQSCERVKTLRAARAVRCVRS